MNEENLELNLNDSVSPEVSAEELQPQKATFEALALMPEMQRAVEAMGFAEPTDIQAQAIPLLRSGADVIARSQTGTGKTMAFAIPAVEMIDRTEDVPTVQVLILCPTRELAQQNGGEIRKLIRFMLNVWPAEVYGGAAMDRQFAQLKRANIVIGTPGRVMDHMRRGTLELSHIRLVVLDEADEMLSMGFREDIETILKDVPGQHQTVLFSATMPDAILELTDKFMKDPQLVEINREQVTLDQIRQQFMEVPMGRKLDALNLLLHSREPERCLIFCNTKLMVDEVSAYLNRSGFACEGIHGDMNQSQRTRVMEGFKAARIPILIATDVAARGIDVGGIDYVINYDIPQNSEIYVHRIGRTGRAGKEGTAITISSGRRQFFFVRDIARSVRTDIEPIPIPTVDEIARRQEEKDLARVREALAREIPLSFRTMVAKLMNEGHEPAMIASAAMQLCFERDRAALEDITVDRKADGVRRYRKLIIQLGRRHGLAPNHVVSAIAGRANIPGAMIGKIEIYDEKTIVGIPEEEAEAVARAMQGATICGQSAVVTLSQEKVAERARRETGKGYSAREGQKPRSFRMGRGFQASREGDADDASKQTNPRRQGRIKLSADAKARLLSTADLGRFEIGSKRRREDRGKDAEHGRFDKRSARASSRRSGPGPAGGRGNRKNADRGSRKPRR